MDTEEFKIVVVDRKNVEQHFDMRKIYNRVEELAAMEPALPVDANLITQNTINGIRSLQKVSINSSEIDDLTEVICLKLSQKNDIYSDLAARVAVSNLHKNTSDDVIATYQHLAAIPPIKPSGEAPPPAIAAFVADFMTENAEWIRNIIDNTSDYKRNYFSISRCKNRYLLRDSNDVVCERPNYLCLRIAVAIHAKYHNMQNYPVDVRSAKLEETKRDIETTYKSMCSMDWTPATPILFNAGTCNDQMASCNLISMGDSTDGIMQTAWHAALLSKNGAGLGIYLGEIRASGTLIKGTRGRSSGAKKLLKILENTMSTFDQGGGKRPGVCAVYMPIYHTDVLDVLRMREQHAAFDDRAHGLFYGIVINDVYKDALLNDDWWYFFNPKYYPEIENSWGKRFKVAYDIAVSNLLYEVKCGRMREEDLPRMKATDVEEIICKIAAETGLPYIINRDAANRKSNQHDIVKQSNLCTEIYLSTSPMQPSSDGIYGGGSETKQAQIATCNLASINVANYIRETSIDETTGDVTFTESEYPKNPGLDHIALGKAAYHAAICLYKIIHTGYSPLLQAKQYNLDSCPIGIGVQNLASAFHKYRLEYGSEESMQLDERIHETIYYGAMCAGVDLAKKYAPYKLYKHSALAKGFLQPDLWMVEKRIKANDLPDIHAKEMRGDLRYDSILDECKWPGFGINDFESLRLKLAKYGCAFSEVTANMPTGGTSQILNAQPSTAPYQTNLFARENHDGTFLVVNKYLLHELKERHLYDHGFALYLAQKNGSVAESKLPADIKRRYRTVWEIGTKTLIKMSARRGWFISQGESLNLFVRDADIRKTAKAAMTGYKLGCKTVRYYQYSTQTLPTENMTMSVSKQQEIVMSYEELFDKIDKDPNFAANFDPTINQNISCLSCHA
jgi:ribonucleoside-diphosphate reductase alpha subunit